MQVQRRSKCTRAQSGHNLMESEGNLLGVDRKLSQQRAVVVEQMCRPSEHGQPRDAPVGPVLCLRASRCRLRPLRSHIPTFSSVQGRGLCYWCLAARVGSRMNTGVSGIGSGHGSVRPSAAPQQTVPCLQHWPTSGMDARSRTFALPPTASATSKSVTLNPARFSDQAAPAPEEGRGSGALCRQLQTHTRSGGRESPAMPPPITATCPLGVAAIRRICVLHVHWYIRLLCYLTGKF